MEEKRNVLRMLEKYDLTEFQLRVLVATAKIPRGETRTYKQIAEQIGHPNAYRAVGTALNKNPLPITIPCHRVVRGDGDIGNYGGGKKKKLKLLLNENAEIANLRRPGRNGSA
jgi:methylated-DNA-[protein]-cysteine S-methyltransferase